MSGGSFSYLCWHTGPYELGANIGELREMADTLDRIQPGGPAWRDTRGVIGLLDAASSLAIKLADVWHDVEWWKSGDYSEEQALEACKDYERRQG